MGHGPRSGRCSGRHQLHTEFILRSCQERAQTVLLDQTLFSLSGEQSLALLADLHDQARHRADQKTVADLLAAPQPWDAAS